jgi:hypothetical protein
LCGPLRFALSVLLRLLLQEWEDPSPCALLRRHRQVSFGIYMARFNAESAAAKTKEMPTMTTTVTAIDGKKPNTKQELVQFCGV